jgi:hypothetical protein
MTPTGKERGSVRKAQLDFDVSRETLNCTAGFAPDARVNLE